VEIVLETDPPDLDLVRTLFREYQSWLGIDLCFQGFEDELATLPGRYAPPAGRIWIARVGIDPVGCVAVRPMAEPEATCEMKRLWVRERYRGIGAGRLLAASTVAFMALAGYRRMRLDTLRSMTAARKLYDEMGFAEIAPYYDNPHDEVVYLELALG
jgi:ribosomal protein S18 acetylase RimI-like enzyme